ncbi:reverse transcriptase domain-containing protein, partial [Tanacetum coccineum]
MNTLYWTESWIRRIRWKWIRCINQLNEYAVLDRELDTPSGSRFDTAYPLDTAYWGFLGVGTTLDIFQNIHILFLEYGVLSLSGYGVLSFILLWSLTLFDVIKVERDPETITDQVLPESTTRVPPPVVQPSPSFRSSETPLSPSPSRSSELPKQNPNQPPISYPSRLNKQKFQDKSDIQVHKFLKMFKKLHFNISLTKALALMPKYAKMLKDLLSDKEKLFGLANTSLTENCSAVLLKKLPENLRDLGKFLIPCDFPELEKCMSLADLAGMAEDVYAQVGKFTFPADFIVVDYDVDPRVPLILGRPFLRTARALVDVYGEELILRDGDEKLIFHADSTSKHPQKHRNESINMINFIDITCEDRFQEVLKIKKSNQLISRSTTFSSASLPGSSFPSSSLVETSDSILEEFADELALLDPFPPRNEDDNFDPEADLREIEYLLNRDPSTDSSPTTNIDIIDPILERFVDEPALVYSSPLEDDDDDLFDFKSDNEEWKKL